MPREPAADCRRRYSKKEVRAESAFSVGRPSLTPSETIEYIRAIAVELYGDTKENAENLHGGLRRPSRR